MKELEILNKAEDLGIGKVGIVSVDTLSGYADRLEARILSIPHGEQIFGWARKFALAGERYPWARSIVVAVSGITQYKVPEALIGLYARHYLFDSRRNPDSPERKKLEAFGEYLREIGLTTAYSEHPGLVPMRHVAQAAGLGIVRKNNFFYTKEHGSFVRISAWLIDRAMKAIHTDDQAPCADDCKKCQNACPTHSLSAPYTMNMASCVSRLTANSSDDTYDDATLREIGRWVYGCDECQTACPFNAEVLHRWESSTTEFPGLTDLAPFLMPETLQNLSDQIIGSKIAPKFFYIDQDHYQHWRNNARNSIINARNP
jgi:epoxyqueuosine reductase